MKINFLDIGVGPGTPDQLRLEVRALNGMALLALFINIFFFVVLSLDGWAYIAKINLAMTLVFMPVLLLNRLGLHDWAKLFALFTAPPFLVSFAYLFGEVSLEGYYFVLMLMVFFVTRGRGARALGIAWVALWLFLVRVGLYTGLLSSYSTELVGWTQRIYWANFSFSIGAVVVLLALLRGDTRRYQEQLVAQRKAIEQQNDEISAQRDSLSKANALLESQKKAIEQQHQDIQDSISYAAIIQGALVPPPARPPGLDTFALWLPRDKVSGDFHWTGSFGGHHVFVVADCTGHGVPGAMMSMLGVALLNGMAWERPQQPQQVLEHMRAQVKRMLGQESWAGVKSKDGMDMALAVIDEPGRNLYFAGANNPLFWVRGGQLAELEPVRNPVGIYLREKPFEARHLPLLPGDQLYLFSDGYRDQTRAHSSEKFKMKRFRELLLEVHALPAPDQRQALAQAFDQWKGPEGQQVDDVLVLGIKVR